MESLEDSQLSPGTMLAHYRLGLPVGSGGMGRVYDAHDTALDRRVAVKVLHAAIAADEETVSRFVREARAAARVNHPNLTHIYFVGGEGACRFFAMEMLPGRTLEQVVLDDGPLDLETAVEILVQAARGLGAAHEAGVVHRDVKPSNLILLPDGTLKVTDFGLAKSITGEADATGTGRIMGTPRYMSPEQCRGETLDHRTDLYSLGLLGWYLLTGRHAFDAGAIGKLLDDQMNRPLPPLAEARPELPERVHRVLARLTAKAPGDRPATAAQAVRLLEEIRPRALTLAPIAARGGALLVDLLLMIAIVAGVTWLAVRAGVLAPEKNLPLLSGLVAFALVAFSQIGLETLNGTSIGKRAFLLRVVRTDGTRPGFGRATARLAVRLPIVFLGMIPVSAPWFIIGGQLVQAIAFVGGAICYFVLQRCTISDVVTSTRVVFKGQTEKTK